MNPQTFIFIGRSGCGKGTQAKLIMESFEKQAPDIPIYYLETGAKFREFIKGDSYSSQLSRKIYEAGDRQPDFLAIWTWSHLVVENLKGNEHLFMDGTPRSLPETFSVLNALDFYGRKANIIYIDVPRELSEQRLMARGRVDDVDKEKIKKRLDWFDKDVMPAVDFFRDTTKHNFIEVNGNRPVEEVYDDIMSKIKMF